MFTCDLCGRSFERQVSLWGHMSKHTDVAAWVCHHCGILLTENNWYPSHRGRRRICISCCNKKNKEQNDRHRDRVNAHNRENNHVRKLKIINAYGGRCECCGDTNPEFLTIDHVEGGGSKHRKSLGRNGKGTHFYQWIISQGFPRVGFRLLCMNCNFSYGKYGYCPHSSERSIFEGLESKVNG